MKLQTIVVGFIFITTISGCLRPTESITALPPQVSSLPAGSTTSMPQLTPTLISMPTTTPTMIATLSVEEAQEKLLNLLSNNGGCRLPCLWGITPGKSTYQEAQVILAPLGGISELTGFIPEGGGIYPMYEYGDLTLYTSIGFNVDTLPDNPRVNRVSFQTEMHKPLQEGGYENIFDSNFFGESITAYTLPHVLSEQGTPSSVMIATAGGPLTRGGTGGFDILLLYPDQGILINYTTQMHLIGPNVRGCPVNAYVEMELYPTGNSDSFFEMLEQTDWAIKFGYYKPLEEVTFMTIDEFYQIFRQATDKCIETPANLWATPEP